MGKSLKKSLDGKKTHRPPFFFASVLSFPVAFLARPLAAFLSQKCASYRCVVPCRVTPRSAQERPSAPDGGWEEAALVAAAAAVAVAAVFDGRTGSDSSSLIQPGGSPDLEGRGDLDLGGGGRAGAAPAPPRPATAGAAATAVAAAAAAAATPRGGGGAARAPAALFPSPPPTAHCRTPCSSVGDPGAASEVSDFLIIKRRGRKTW